MRYIQRQCTTNNNQQDACVVLAASMTSKKDHCVESKKRKAAALLHIASLNDQDINQLKEDEDTVGSKSKKPRLKGADYETLRAMLKKRKKQLKRLPKFELKKVGHNAGVDNLESNRTPLFMSDLQHLLVYLMVGDLTPYRPFRWCTIEKWNRIPNVIVLIIDDGLGVNQFLSHRDQEASRIDAIFPMKMEVVSPESYNSNMAKDLCILPASQTRKKSLLRLHGSMDEMLKSGEAFRFFQSVFPVQQRKEVKKVESNLTNIKLRLLLSAEQMIKEGYPVPLPGYLSKKYEQYVTTKDSYEEVSSQSPLFGLDCEMCLTQQGMELTRICVVDEELKIVYHALVKPHNPIRNYVTRYSGITPDMLKDVTTQLADVQQKLRELLPGDAILIGQSLNSDLHALKMMHPYVIDTSVIYNITGIRGRKTKLATLSAMFLGQTIQNKGKQGHDPQEDAIAAIKLVKLKMEKGYEFGDVILSGHVPKVADMEESEEGSSDSKEQIGIAMMNEITLNKKISLICQRKFSDTYNEMPQNAEYITEVDSAKEAISKACESAFENNLTICHLSCSRKSNESKFWKRVNKYTSRLWSHTSQNGLFMTIWNGSKDDNAFVGIALNKHTPDEPVDSAGKHTDEEGDQD